MFFLLGFLFVLLLLLVLLEEEVGDRGDGDGGGEGRAKGNHPQTPWGKPTKGARTRHNPRTDKYIVAARKKK